VSVDAETTFARCPHRRRAPTGPALVLRPTYNLASTWCATSTARPPPSPAGSFASGRPTPTPPGVAAICWPSTSAAWPCSKSSLRASVVAHRAGRQLAGIYQRRPAARRGGHERLLDDTEPACSWRAVVARLRTARRRSHRPRATPPPHDRRPRSQAKKKKGRPGRWRAARRARRPPRCAGHRSGAHPGHRESTRTSDALPRRSPPGA